MTKTLAAAVALALLAGCSGEERRGTDGGDRTDEPAAATPAPPPDAGTRAGHGADPGRVAVPARDPSPPEAVVTLRDADGRPLARASQPPGPQHPDPVALRRPRLRGTTVGRDPDGGVARVRVSIKERIACRGAGGRRYRRLRTRYFPPPQTERIRSNPGARLPTTLTRTRRIALAADRCRPGTPLAVHGELWGEAINGAGLEAVTPHLRFTWRPIPPTP